jgi:hypothetical protein
MSSKIRIIRELLSKFCLEILNSEAYDEICYKILDKLEQHPDQPLNRGKEDIWAASIAHAVGSINLLFSSSSHPHISVDELNSFFGTRSTTTSKKSLDLRDLLRISPYNPDFQINKSQDELPMDQMKEMIAQQFDISEEDVDTLLSNINRSNSPIIPKSNYSAITIVPKQKFWDWAGTQINLEEMDPAMKTDCNVYLVPDIELESALEVELHTHFKEIFKIELARYINNDSDFPEINFIEFLQWFEIKSSSHVMDLTGELLNDFDDEDFFDEDFGSKDKNLPPDFSQN